MKLSIIAAMTEEGVIGVQNTLPWRLPADLKRFKDITMDHPIILGRKTYDSIGKPLPGRTNVVVTRQKDFQRAGIVVVHSLADAIKTAQAADGGAEEVFVIGGGLLYEEAMPLVDRIYLTIIHYPFAGDTYFPDIDLEEYDIVEQDEHPPTDDTQFGYTFLTADRKVEATSH